MNEEFRIELKRSFRIVDNGNGTQNLHSLVYANSRLISECDLGNIEDILIQNKELKATNESLTSLVNSCQNKIRQVQNNWNEFKKWLEEEIESKLNGRQKSVILYVYKKVQELEKGKDE